VRLQLRLQVRHHMMQAHLCCITDDLLIHM
jgi:hypothetical protein